MSARIDHAAEAQKLEQNAWQRGGPLGDQLIRTHEQRQDMILSAQVHATLALVGEQRIANYIAYVQLLEAQYAEAVKNADQYDWATREASVARHGEALARIREGLGL